MSKRSKRRRKHKRLKAQAKAMKSPAAIKKKGLAAFHRKDFTQAIKDWRRLKLDTEPTMVPALAEAYFRRALVGGVRPDSRADLQRAIDLTPDDGRLWYHLGLAHHSAGELDAAEAAYARAVELGYQAPGFTRALAALEQNPHTDLDALDSLSPSDRATLAPIAMLLRDSHAAIEAYALTKDSLVDRFKGSRGKHGQATFWRGLALFASGHMDAARQALANAPAQHLRPGAEAVRAFYAGMAAAAVGEAAEAQSSWAQAAAKKRLTPHMTAEIANLQMRLVHEHIAAGDWDMALEAAEAALAATPGDRSLAAAQLIAANQLASTAAAAGQWDTALRHWEAMRDTLKNSPAKFGPLLPVVHNIAIAYEALERWEAAAEAWNTAMKSLPRRGKAAESSPKLRAWMRQRVLENYKKSGQPDKAIKHYRQAVKANPDDLETHLELADALLANDQEVAARNELNRILGKAPRHVEARMRLAEVHQMRGEHYMVERELRRVLEIDPNHDGARQAFLDRLLERGQRQLGMGWIEDARAAFESGLEIAPGDPKLIVELGRIDLIEAEIDSARDRFETALAANKPEIFTHVFECWASEQEMDEARRILERAETAGHSTPDFYTNTALECFRAEPASGLGLLASSLAGPRRKSAKEKSLTQWEQLGHDLLQRAIAADSDESGAPSPSVLQRIVFTLGMERPDIALEYSRQWASIAPDDPAALMRLGLLEAMNDETRAAQATLRKAARLARKQGRDDLAAEIDDLRQQINHPLFSLLGRLPGLPDILAGFDDDDDFFDDQYYSKG